jgi:hypothetical protein
LEEEKATLGAMVESHDELLMEIARKIGLAHMGEDDEDEEECEDANDGEDAAVDISYVALQAHGIVNIALHREYSPGIVLIFSLGRKDLYHV